MLYRHHISRNKEATITITDANFPSINPNDILTITPHFQNLQTSQLIIGAYSASINLLKDYVVEFCRFDIELTHLFGTQKVLVKITCELPEAQILAAGPIEEPELGYVYLKKKTNIKYFLRVFDKNLIPSSILQKLITNVAKGDAPEHVKNKFINHLK